VPKPTKPKPINWVAIRAEYEAGGVTLQQLANRLGVSLKTVARRSSKESWRDGVQRVSKEVSLEVSKKVRDNIVSKRVEKALSDLDMINNVISLTYSAIIENPDNFKTTGEAIASLDRMQKIKLEYTQERIEKWLYERGYIAIPIAELTTTIEDNDSSTEPIGAFSDILRTESDTASPVATEDQQ
jgi:transcriptional regulator with XRE-family HTH domain